MEDLKKLQKAEALERLKVLQEQFELLETVVNDYEIGDYVHYSEYINKVQQGILYWVNGRQDIVTAIEKFEGKHQAVVYHVILTPTVFGDMLTLLYVSPHQEEWERDKEELIEGLPCAYCINGDCSEFGGIQIAGANGGITRLN